MTSRDIPWNVPTYKTLYLSYKSLSDMKIYLRTAGFVLTLTICSLLFINSVQEKAKYRYIGSEKCASVCHNTKEMGFQYDIMKNGPHSKAFEILGSGEAFRYARKADIKGNPRESAKCLQCHITGAGLDTSFFAGTYKKEDGVSCEACHKGPYITKAFIPTAEVCLACHNNSVHKTGNFDFTERCSRIAHPRPKSNLSK
jgi:hypothetical protein